VSADRRAGSGEAIASRYTPFTFIIYLSAGADARGCMVAALFLPTRYQDCVT